MEKMVSFLVAAFSLVVIFCVLALQGTEHAITGAQLASGLRLAMPVEGAFTALAVMGSVGATAVELFIYPYWIREKGYPAGSSDRATTRREWRGTLPRLDAGGLRSTPGSAPESPWSSPAPTTCWGPRSSTSSRCSPRATRSSTTYR